MHDVRLKIVEKNEILGLIRGAGLNLRDFSWSGDDSSEHDESGAVYFTVSVLRHLPTDYYCKFGGDWVEISPGPDQRVEMEPHQGAWGIKREVAKLWLEELRKEVDAPDLWASIAGETALARAASSPSLENRSFTPDEMRRVAAGLEEIKRHLIEGQHFTQGQREYVDEQFRYFREACDRLGRKDWLNLVFGGLVSLVIELALDPKKTKGILRLAGTAFQFLWVSIHGFLP